MPSTSSPEGALRIDHTLLVGSLIFGLFFGAGNLIFPVQLGLVAGSAVPAATIGFLASAVGLPLIAIVASAVAHSRTMTEMVSPVGRWYAVAFTCALYLTIGPFFAIPRTATVSYEVGFSSLLPDAARPWALVLFSLAFFVVTGAAALRPGRLLDYVGRYLTPLFLVLLGVVLVAAVLHPASTGPLPAPTDGYAGQPVVRGLLDGYQTMDALGSLPFAIVIVDAVRRLGVSAPGRAAVEITKASLVTLIVMSAIYTSLTLLGAYSHPLAPRDANGATLLAAVGRHYFGPFGHALMAAIMLVACLKTAIGLVTACAAMFAELFPRISRRTWVLIFTAVSCLIANAGLSLIVAAAVPVLRFLYPLVIIATVLGLLTPWIGDRTGVHRVATAFVGLAALLDAIHTLPAIPVLSPLADAAGRLLPGFELGFGWVVPAVVGLALGWLLPGRTRRGAGS